MVNYTSTVCGVFGVLLESCRNHAGIMQESVRLLVEVGRHADELLLHAADHRIWELFQFK